MYIKVCKLNIKDRKTIFLNDTFFWVRLAKEAVK